MKKRFGCYSKILNNKNYIKFAAGSIVSGFGDVFQFIAVTTLLVRITGTGLSAGFIVLCTPIASLLFSAIAGIIGDRVNQKKTVILFDLMKGLTAFVFILCHDTNTIYLLMVILASLEVLYTPPHKKLMIGILGKNDIIKGNSLLNVLAGFVFAAGPVLAGFIIFYYGVKICFIFNGLSFLFSAAVTVLIGNEANIPTSHSSYRVKNSFILDLITGLKHIYNNVPLKKIITVTTVVCFTGTAINTAFYPYAFDILRVTERGWGFMMSLFYGTNIAALLVPVFKERKNIDASIILITVPLFVLSTVWFGYGVFKGMGAVLLLQIFEGTAACLFWVYAGSLIQILPAKAYTARIIGINELINNLGKLAGICFAYVILYVLSIKYIFLISSAVIFLFTLCVSTRIVESKPRIICKTTNA